MKKKNVIGIVFSIGLLFILSTKLHAAIVDVNCGIGESLGDAVNSAPPNTTISVTGTCYESITIRTNDLTLIGDDSGTKTTLSGVYFPPRAPLSLFEIDGAVRVNISGFVLEKAFFGINAKDNAAVTVKNTDVRNNFIGVNITTNSLANLEDINIQGTEPGAMILGLALSENAVVHATGTINMSGSAAFGFDLTGGSALTLVSQRDPANGVVFNSFDNVLGGEIAIGSSFFANSNSAVNIYNNATIGFSCNTGSTCMFFHATLNSHDNARDGVDVISGGNLNLDGNSTLTSENNGREGISIDDSTLNMFGFFAEPGFPKIISNNNANNGVQIEFGGKLDVGRNSSIIAMNNGAAGVSLDDGSSAILQRSEMSGNHGSLHDSENYPHQNADVVATFGSRVTFRTNPDNAGDTSPNNIGLALCDQSSMARGDVKCKRRN